MSYHNSFTNDLNIKANISDLDYRKADYEDVKDLEKHDRKQDQSIVDIKDMILELHYNQLAMKRYMEEKHDFDHERFNAILTEVQEE
ncbi:MAG: DUF2828 domain-containing protein [Lentisphaeraceae bacterium]|nr:DUF2828 domain-containing protein [Lentisphaeraceae bacterium]